MAEPHSDPRISKTICATTHCGGLRRAGFGIVDASTTSDCTNLVSVVDHHAVGKQSDVDKTRLKRSYSSSGARRACGRLSVSASSGFSSPASQVEVHGKMKSLQMDGLKKCLSLPGIPTIGTASASLWQDSSYLARPKWMYVVQFGNNSTLVRSLLGKRQWWSPGMGDPDNSSCRIFYDVAWRGGRVEVGTNIGTSEINLLWTQKKNADFLDAMADGTSVAVKVNEETGLRLELKQRPYSHARMHNHFEGNNALVTKTGLCESLIQFYSKCGIDPFGRVPLTFILRCGSRDEEFAAWCRVFETLLAESSQKVWLVKPAGLNQGRGIQVFDSIEAVQQHIDSKDVPWVVQKYIESPLLIRQRKFDIRAFCLVRQEQAGGPFHVYYCKDGYLRLTSDRYTLQTLESTVHITNDQIQRKGKDYSKFELGNKMSFNDFSVYLRKQHGISFQRDIVPQMRDHMKDCIRSVTKKLNPRQIDHCFEIYGFDFLIDANYHVWLLEVNVNPSLETHQQHKAQLFPAMVDEALRLTVDRVFAAKGAWTDTGRCGEANSLWEHIYCSGDSVNIGGSGCVSQGRLLEIGRI